MSAVPPAGKGTISLRGREGCCARTGSVVAAVVAASARTARRVRVGFKAGLLRRTAVSLRSRPAGSQNCAMRKKSTEALTQRIDKDFVTSLQKGLDVLTSFSRQHSKLTLSEVARLTGSSPA